MLIPKHFRLEEYFPKHMVKDFGDKCWQLLDERVIITNDGLREEFGPIYINTWWSDKLTHHYGSLDQSGFRSHEHYRDNKSFNTPEENNLRMFFAYIRSRSQHKYGRASDLKFRDANVHDVRSHILRHPDKYPFIMAIELGTRWLHWDCRNCSRIMTFYP